MTKQELLDWIEKNKKVYPVFEKLYEQKISKNAKKEKIIILPCQYGKYNGLMIAFDGFSAMALRTAEVNAAVASVESYDMAKILLLECAKWVKKHDKFITI